MLVLDELRKQGREWGDFLQEINLSPGHPPTEDVPPAVDAHIENPSIDVPLPNVTPSQADTSLPADSPLVDPPSDDLVHKQTPAQEVHHRRSMWKTPKRKRGSNQPVVSEVKETLDPPQRLTRSTMKKKNLSSPQHMNVPTEPINLTTPLSSQSKSLLTF